MKPQASVNYAELTLGQGWQPSWWPSTWNGKAVKEESRDGSSLRALEWKVPFTRIESTFYGRRPSARSAYYQSKELPIRS